MAGGREEREDMGEEGGRGLGEGAWRVENRACNYLLGTAAKQRGGKWTEGRRFVRDKERTTRLRSSGGHGGFGVRQNKIKTRKARQSREEVKVLVRLSMQKRREERFGFLRDRWQANRKEQRNN